jgi:small redox-active disulfide protein 2
MEKKMIVKILGTGCPNCKKLERNTEEALKELKIETKIVEIKDIDEIMSYGIMTPPALVVDEKLLVYGQVPAVAEIKDLIQHRDSKEGNNYMGCDCNSCDHGCF